MTSPRPTIALACMATLAACPITLAAQDGEPAASPEPAGVPPEVVDAPPPAVAAETPDVPDDAIDEWSDVFTKGKFSADFRFRYEYAVIETPTTDFGDSNALTLRSRLGFSTAPVYGLSGFVELEDIRALDDDEFNAAGLNGQPDLSVIADPEDTELNQLYLKWSVPDDLGDTLAGSNFVIGRQRIILDNHRFVGNVGWRQNEQTFDAGVIDYKPNAIDDLRVFYGYVRDVNRIFGPDSGRDFDSDSHLVNVSYDIENVGKLVAFAYLIDLRDDAPLLSSQSYGLLLTGKQPLGDAADELTLGYTASVAWQQDFGDNPVDYDAVYVNADATLTKKGLGSVGVGYELLGSDDGQIGFSTPLATLHKFNGFADAFLNTPADGLQDFYVSVGADLPWDVKAKVIGHYFLDVEDGDDLGYEIDAVASKRFNPYLTVLGKAAFFDGDGGQPDITRLWLQAELKF